MFFGFLADLATYFYEKKKYFLILILENMNIEKSKLC